MKTRKYSLGLDFGSLSARALLVDVRTGEEVADCSSSYRHGFMEDVLVATGEKLSEDWTLQDPADYLEAMERVVQDVLIKSGVSPDDIVGIGVDFTSCTVLPIKDDGTPLCFLPEYRENKHAYVKKWKHHAAQAWATEITELALERDERFIKRLGGKVSSEYLMPKLWQILAEDSKVYDAMDAFVEAGDWIVMQLTGELKRSACQAGYKAFWSKDDGYPSKDFFAALDPRLENVVEDKLDTAIYPLGMKAGELTNEMAEKLGLKPGTAVAVAVIDAHVAVPAAGISKPGSLLLIIGTSTCFVCLDEKEHIVPGMSGLVADGVLPGYYGYEAGQACVGDHFDWFVSNLVPESYEIEARDKGWNKHRLLREKAQQLKAGESGLLALDWWNGNRSILVDSDLTGLMLGLTLQTKPEEIYRALLEATAYGARKIVETFIESGLEIDHLYACGGIASKDDLMMQIYSDVIGMPLTIAASDQTVAFGAAMFGAVAGGREAGGYDSMEEAIAVMPRESKKEFVPIKENQETYEQLYQEYVTLHDYFGRGKNDVMKRLKAIKLDKTSS